MYVDRLFNAVQPDGNAGNLMVPPHWPTIFSISCSQIFSIAAAAVVLIYRTAVMSKFT